MGAVRHAVRVVSDAGFSVPVRRQPPLFVGYEHFRLDRQGALLSPKTLEYYDETVLPFLRWLEAEGAVDSIRSTSDGSAAFARISQRGLESMAGLWRRRRSWSTTGRSCVSCAGLVARAMRLIRGSSS